MVNMMWVLIYYDHLAFALEIAKLITKRDPPILSHDLHHKVSV